VLTVQVTEYKSCVHISIVQQLQQPSNNQSQHGLTIGLNIGLTYWSQHVVIAIRNTRRILLFFAGYRGKYIVVLFTLKKN
jgi:hypothetical protein